MFSFLLDQALNDEAAAHSALTQSLHDEMMARLAGGNSVKKHFPAIAEALSSVIPNAGVAAWLDGEFLAQGQTPHEGDVRDLVGFLERTGVRGVYSTEKLGEVYAPARDYTDCAAGLLAIPVSRMGGDYVLLFREEITKTVSWGGNPEKPVTYGPNGPRLTPRKSFEEWKETVRGHSAPWTEAEIGAAEQLRVTLLEVVLRLADEASQERARAHERQELLIAELNHRVRNILNLIRGLVTQSARDACTAEELSEMVGGRIQALARAHDQITLQNWAPASVRQLIRTELEAYFGEKAGRIRLSGPDALIQPAAFSTLSLVIHELATNSAKYGALSDSRGSIEVTLSPTESDGLALSWRESGGPPVQAPTRQGFGTTIIENSVPFELRGTAELHFELTGLEADFTIPSSHVHAFQTVEDEQSERSTTLERKAPPQARFNGPALVLEDNMIIALDAEELVSQLGATSVTVCAGVEEALGAVERNDFAFALLDVNLGRETSEPVAEALRERGVPFAFATGYGEAASLVSRFPDAPVLKKPYREDMLSAVVEQALQAPGG